MKTRRLLTSNGDAKRIRWGGFGRRTSWVRGDGKRKYRFPDCNNFNETSECAERGGGPGACQPGHSQREMTNRRSLHETSEGAQTHHKEAERNERAMLAQPVKNSRFI